MKPIFTLRGWTNERNFVSLHPFSHPFTAMKKILLFLLSLSLYINVSAYELIRGQFAGSEIYPGTVRDFVVSVPEGYDPAGAPLPLYVGLDGILCDAPHRLDSLAAAGDIPPMIGVYIQSGLVRNDAGDIVRYNRSNEFDAITPAFATFLEEEFLPYVANLTTADGRPIRFTDDPQQRMIFGLSSGGICAFKVAWQRPDLFRKVYTGCGTFVPMRGGEQLQVLVRKAEPRPLKVYLQDGYSDTWNPVFGSWFEANVLLNSGLEFAGYEVNHDWAEGGHSVKRTTEIFPEVMKWMWSDGDGPRPTGNGTLAATLVEGEDWAEVDTAPLGAPAAVEARYPDGAFVVRPIANSNLLEQAILTADGTELYAQPFYYLHSISEVPFVVSDMAFDSDGYLWVLTNAGIQMLDQNGRVRGIISLPRGHEFNALNIGRNEVTVSSPDGTTFRRRFTVSPATPGITPKSQGQG